MHIIKYLPFLLSATLWAQTASQVQTSFHDLSTQEQERVRSVANELRCPTCTGLSVMQSDAAFSLQIRQHVIDLVKEGKSDSEIIAFFTDSYGLWILREPPTSGFHQIAWLLPILLLLLGPFLIWFLVWRQPQTISSQGIRSDEAILQEMNQKLAALQKGNS